MEKGFRVRIYPQKWQEEKLFEYCRLSHYLWNFLVGKYKKENTLPPTCKFGIIGYKTEEMLREANLEEAPKRISFGVIKTYAQAVNNFRSKIAGLPKFHKFIPARQSFYLASTKWKIDWKDGSIAMPTNEWKKCAKSKRIKMDMTYIIKEGITEVREPRFSFYEGKWFLSGCYIVSDANKKEDIHDFLGLDWGIKNFFTSSEGEFINYPSSVLREFQRCNRLKSLMDKKVFKSNNYYKLKNKYHRARIRLRNLQKDFIEKKTAELIRKYNIVLEDLSDEALNGFVIERRRNAIYPYHWFVRKLEWKGRKNGVDVIYVSAAYTSKTCCKCGSIHEDMTLKDRTMICECGNIMDRDINAAINIRNAGISARGTCHTL